MKKPVTSYTALITCLVLVLLCLHSLSEATRRGRGRHEWRERERARRGRGLRHHRPRDEGHHRSRVGGGGHQGGQRWRGEVMPGGRRHQVPNWRHLGRQRPEQSEGSRRHPLMDFIDLVPFLSLDFSHSSGPEEQAWWEGPNVCESKTEEFQNSTESRPLLRHFRSTSQSCDASETAYKCQTTQHSHEGRVQVTVVQHCCHGYSRQEGDFGCPTASDLTDLVTTAQDHNLTDFVRAVRLLHLTEVLQQGNWTVFAPVNGAFGLDSDLLDTGDGIMLRDQPDMIAVSESATQRVVEALKEAIMGHVVPGLVTSSRLEDEQLLDTDTGAGSTIRVNYFSVPQQNQIMTANCVPVVSRDVMATNGVIHSVEKAIKPVTSSLMELVAQREDLTTLKTVLAAAGSPSLLSSPGHLTLLAPNNAAFRRMSASLRKRLLAGDQDCLLKVLHHHVLPHVICTSAIVTSSGGQTSNLLHRHVNMTSRDGKTFVEDVQVVDGDVMASNGVMHVIDEVIVPEDALSVVEVLERQGFTELLALMKKSGLTKFLADLDNVSVFAPTNHVLQNLPTSVTSQLSDPEVLRHVLSYHVSTEVQHHQYGYHDNAVYGTLSGDDIRVNHYRWMTAQCVPIKKFGIKACNGRVNILENIMLPPRGNVIDVLALNPQFSMFVSLLKQSGLADSLQEDGPFTVFAPNNQAIRKLGKRALASIKRDKAKLADLIKRHVFANNLCCAGIVRGSWFSRPEVRVMSGRSFKLSRDRRSGLPMIGSAHVVTCDLTATNGNVLETDGVLSRPSHKTWLFNPFAWRF